MHNSFECFFLFSAVNFRIRFEVYVAFKRQCGNIYITGNRQRGLKMNLLKVYGLACNYGGYENYLRHISNEIKHSYRRRNLKYQSTMDPTFLDVFLSLKIDFFLIILLTYFEYTNCLYYKDFHFGLRPSIEENDN